MPKQHGQFSVLPPRYACPVSDNNINKFDLFWQMIIQQTNRDKDVCSLLTKMNEIYTFLTQQELRDIESMKILVATICKQTLECSYFIRRYAQDPKFRKLVDPCKKSCEGIHLLTQGSRFLENLLSDTDERVRTYNNTFEELMQQIRDRATRDTLVVVHRIWEDLTTLGNSPT